jgi:hypothetical protein
MRVAAALFLALHGLAHLVGFRAAFWPTPGVPVRGSLFGGLLGVGYFGTRTLGVVWLMLALGYLVSAALFLLRSPSWSAVTLGVTCTSAMMCLLYWPDARIGLFIDVVLFAIVLALSRASSAHLAAAFHRELERAALPAQPGPTAIVDEATLEELPSPVRRYMRFMGVVGKPRDWSLRAKFAARFRTDAGPWLKCEVLQYDTRLQLARVFYMQLSLKHVLPVTVRDTYVKGRGTMLAKAFDAFTVVEGKGHEIDVGELVTYLNDAILMAPSLLLGPEVTWREVDDDSFEVTLRDGSLSVTGRVQLDEQGAPRDFSTNDRFYDTPDGKRVRTEWRTPVSSFQDVGGRKLPRQAQAVWQLPEGPFVYADFRFDPTQVSFNVPPS